VLQVIQVEVVEGMVEQVINQLLALHHLRGEFPKPKNLLQAVEQLLMLVPEAEAEALGVFNQCQDQAASVPFLVLGGAEVVEAMPETLAVMVALVGLEWLQHPLQLTVFR
jgi:hypothetical protein